MVVIDAWVALLALLLAVALPGAVAFGIKIGELRERDRAREGSTAHAQERQ